MRPPENDPFLSMIVMVEDDAWIAYEEGGVERLAAFMGRLDSKLPGERHLTDLKGRDLLTGEDRSSWLVPSDSGPRRTADGRVVLVSRPRRGRYRFITIIRPWFEPPSLLPYYAAVVAVITGMGTILAGHIAAPLRQLSRVVDRFGRGDLTARSGSRRRDEIGELARTFDAMAGRIEALLSAELRLLQDISHELRSPLTRLDVTIKRFIGAEVARCRPRRAVSRAQDLPADRV